MPSERLKNLVKLGELHEEAPSPDEVAKLTKAGIDRLVDAERTDLSYASRFDLAYNAAHSLAVAALRRSGYRSSHNRYIVFQVLPDTVGLDTPKMRVLAKAHEVRNRAEYEGIWDEDDQLLADVLVAARAVAGLLEP